MINTMIFVLQQAKDASRTNRRFSLGVVAAAGPL